MSWSCDSPKRANRMTISSTKNKMKTDMRQMPSTQGYSVMGPVRHSSVNASLAGAKSCKELLVLILQIRRSRKSMAYMYESGGHDDTRAKVFCDEEGP
jgi:hypothetical protein